jgi:PAS domain S-box-containing protein
LALTLSHSHLLQDAVDFAQLDLDELFVDCYYDVPGMSSMMNSTSYSNNDEAAPAPAPVAAATEGGAAPQPVPVTSGSSSSGTSRKRPVPSGQGGEDYNDEDDDPDDIMNKPISELTDKQKLERRERNREHAKRSRLRKKFLLESLQEQIHGLQEQIEKFKDTLRAELNPQKADHFIDQICGNEAKYTPLPMPSGFGPVKTLMEPDFRLMSALSGSQQNFAISDPTLPDNPIVYVSQGFLDLTGYQLDQVLGRNCRFLQGPGTDQSAVDVIRKGIAEGIDTSVCLLNYKADGTPFWNQFFVAALRDAENNVVNYVGVQCEVSKAVVEKHMGDKAKTAVTAAAK